MSINTIVIAGFCFLAGRSGAQDCTLKPDCKPLKGGVCITEGKVWDDLLEENCVNRRWLVPGFTVNLGGIACDSFLIAQGKLVGIEGNAQVHMGFALDFCDRGIGTNAGKSPIKWKVTGRKGKRILKVEWQNVGFFEEWSYEGECCHFLNFQVWVHEKGQRMELRLGKLNLTAEQTDMIVQALNPDDAGRGMKSLTGQP